MEDDLLAEIYLERENEYTLAGSIYKGRVTRVLPGMQSAFVDIGLERDAFLYVSDFMELEEGDDVDDVPTGRVAEWRISRTTTQWARSEAERTFGSRERVSRPATLQTCDEPIEGEASTDAADTAGLPEKEVAVVNSTTADRLSRPPPSSRTRRRALF